MKLLTIIQRSLAIPALVLFFSGIGLLLTSTPQIQSSMHLLRAFSSGVFIAIFFFDVIPDLLETIQLPKGNVGHKKIESELIFPFVVLVGAYFFTLFVNKATDHDCSEHSNIENHENQQNHHHEGHNHESRNHESHYQDTFTHTENGIEIQKEEPNQKPSVSKKKQENHDNLSQLMLTFLIHDFFTGMFISMQIEKKGFFSIFFALAIHKFIECVSLGIRFGVSEKNKFRSFTKLSTFPLAILIGTAFGFWLKGAYGSSSGTTRQAMIGGTFLFVALSEGAVMNFHKIETLGSKVNMLVSFVFGLGFSFLIFNHEQLF